MEEQGTPRWAHAQDTSEYPEPCLRQEGAKEKKVHALMQ